MFSLMNFHILIVQSHIFAGFTALIAYWIPLLTPKGSIPHKRVGKIYYYTGSYVVITAALSSAWAMMSPGSFYDESIPGGPTEDLAFLFATLLSLSVLVFADLRLGVRLIRTKNTPEKLGTPLEKAIRASSGLIAAWLLCYGVWRLLFTGEGAYILCIVVGLIGVAATPGTYKFMSNPAPTERQWLYKHIEVMIGSGIGFHVAFFLFGFRRFDALQWMDGPIALLLLTLPFVAGFSAIHLWTRLYRRKFSDT